MNKKLLVDLLFREMDFVREWGYVEFFKKILNRPILLKKINILRILLIAPISFPFVVIIRIIRPWFLVRIGVLNSNKIGHCAAETELYLCKQDEGINVPEIPYMDLWYLTGVEHWVYNKICNAQLIRMWKRRLRVWTGLTGLFLNAVDRINRLIPGYEIHEADPSQGARDIHNLYDRYPAHIDFLTEEYRRGQAGLLKMGIPQGVPFVLLFVRDAAYLNTVYGSGLWVYHNYRDSNIQDYLQAAEELTKRGYYVIRMGAVVKDGINIENPMVIDYAFNGMRSDFMDIYLGAKCAFCISTGAGFDAVPTVFRRPILYVNHLPPGQFATHRAECISITKMHWLIDEARYMSFQEIFESGACFFLGFFEYESAGIKLIDNSPEEIKEAVVEMAERLNGTWQPEPEDEFLQRQFWSIFPKDAIEGERRLHGEIRSRVGAAFLRKYRDLIAKN